MLILDVGIGDAKNASLNIGEWSGAVMSSFDLPVGLGQGKAFVFPSALFFGDMGVWTETTRDDLIGEGMDG